MTRARATGAAPRRWPWGLLALLAMALLLVAQPPSQRRLQAAWFDALQTVAPRVPRSAPVVIVAIDDRSLQKLGQWPWPRTVLADLLRTLEHGGPAAIGIDVLMPEPDRLSPALLVQRVAPTDHELAQRLAALPSNDALLADAIAAAPVVLAAAGADDAAGGPLHAVPVLVTGRGAEPGVNDLPRYPAVIANLDELDRAAAGHGLISTEPTRAIQRRLPLLFDILGTLAPSMAVEMLRVAQRQPLLRLTQRGADARRLTIGKVVVPIEADGTLRVHYARAPRPRTVSAADVLDGSVDLAPLLRDKLVLIGITAAGLGDLGTTPMGDSVPGVEIHAQLIENLVDAAWLRRPVSAPAIELALFVALGLALVWATPRWPARRSALLALGAVALPALVAFAAFEIWRVLLDATPVLYLLPLFALLLVLTLAEAARRRHALERAIRDQREREAFLTGELAAAQRIQVGMLPSPRALQHERRIDLAAAMAPARAVGGDLYDFFMLDDQRLYLMIGDVSGKGVAASLFMAMAKALCKSVALRDPAAGPAALMNAALTEIGRDNAAQLFVTMFIGLLDLDSGELAYCNAGHDDPILLTAADTAAVRLSGGDGPPLCAVDGFDYTGATHRLSRGDTLCLFSDGVVDALDARGSSYGDARLATTLQALRSTNGAAQPLVDGLCADLTAFVGNADPADDITVLVLRWLGPAGDD